jgi:hypothetical protein
MTVSRATRLLPVAIVLAAIVLFASELMTTFEFTPPGGEVLASQGGADRHGNALMVIAVFAVIALGIAVFTGSKPAAIAVAVAGVAALLVFLLSDLPDANAVGTLDDARNSFFDAEAVPQEGFFLEMLGALALAIGGVALATMSEDQLRALRPPKREKPPAGRDADAPGAKPGAANPAPEGATAHAKSEQVSRLSRRPRARQRGREPRTRS